MEKNVKVINYENDAFDTGVAYEDVVAIAVNIWSGDEMLTIFTKDGKVHQYDAADYRYRRSDSFDDGHYFIYPVGFEKWDARTSAYSWTEDGYFDE